MMNNTKETQTEAFDDDIADLSSPTLLCTPDRYKDMLLEYCTLAIQSTLTEIEQDRMAEILQMGVEDAVLNFWLEEGDHLVAHHLGLIDEAFIENQQDNFRRSIRQGLVDSLWKDLQSSSKVLQAYLRQQGVYHGSIDGVMGPNTREALRKLRERSPNALTELRFT